MIARKSSVPIRKLSKVLLCWRGKHWLDGVTFLTWHYRIFDDPLAHRNAIEKPCKPQVNEAVKIVKLAQYQSFLTAFCQSFINWEGFAKTRAKEFLFCGRSELGLRPFKLRFTRSYDQMRALKRWLRQNFQQQDIVLRKIKFTTTSDSQHGPEWQWNSPRIR